MVVQTYSLVALYSISGDAARREDVKKMAQWLSNQLSQYGVETQFVPLGTQVLDGKTLELPPAVIGKIGNDSSKKTILIYGHFDVQPVRI